MSIGKLPTWKLLREGKQNFANSRRENVSKPGTPNLNYVSWQLKSLRKEYTLSES